MSIFPSLKELECLGKQWLEIRRAKLCRGQVQRVLEALVCLSRRLCFLGSGLEKGGSDRG